MSKNLIMASGAPLRAFLCTSLKSIHLAQEDRLIQNALRLRRAFLYNALHFENVSVISFFIYSLFILWFLNIQNIPKTKQHLLVTCNPPHLPKEFLLKWSTGQYVPSVAALRASFELGNIQGKRGIWFCGAYHGKLHKQVWYFFKDNTWMFYLDSSDTFSIL